jgi:hypothetical protein
MNNVKKLFAICTLAPVISVVASVPSQAAVTPYVETALVEVCKSAKRNNVYQFKKTTAAYRLNDKTVALKVMCNGDSIIKFAEKYNALETSAYLAKTLGKVSITDLAKVEKYQVMLSEE